MPKHLTKKKQGAVNRSLFLNFIQLFIQQGNRQSDHVKVVALDLPDKQRTLALNSVSACFVRRLARGDVFLDLRVAKFIKFNLGDLRKPDHSAALKNCAAGYNEVSFDRQQFKDLKSRLVGFRLADHLVVNKNTGIAADNRVVGVQLVNILRLFKGKVLRNFIKVNLFVNAFVNVRRFNFIIFRNQR